MAATRCAQVADERLYLDDLHVGARFTSGTHLIDEAQIKSFAGQFDPQLFHLDHEAAKGTLFDGLAASGWHTAAITMRLLVDNGLPIAGGIIGSGRRRQLAAADAARGRPASREPNRGRWLRPDLDQIAAP